MATDLEWAARDLILGFRHRLGGAYRPRTVTLAGVVRRDAEHSRVYLRCRDTQHPLGLEIPLRGLAGYNGAVASSIFPTLVAVGQEPALFGQVTSADRPADEYAPRMRLLTEETDTRDLAAELDAATGYVLDDCFGDPSERDDTPTDAAVPDIVGYMMITQDVMRLYIPVHDEIVGADIRLLKEGGHTRRTHDVTGALLWDQVAQLRRTGSWEPPTRLPGDTYCDWAAEMGIWV
jgi:hypothetical protein